MPAVVLPPINTPLVDAYGGMSEQWYRFFTNAIVQQQGNWTPVDASGVGIPLSIANGRFTRLGQIVILNGQVAYPVTASPVDAKIGGLPFRPSTQGTALPSGGSCIFTTGPNPNAMCGIFFTVPVIYFSNAANASVMTNANMANRTAYFSLVYMTDQ